jgi:alginate O-acetyltransferase complex protein AlgJ
MRTDLPQRSDPVEALAAFHDQLAERGIQLVVVPLPVKASIHPEQLSASAPADRAIQSASHEAFIAAMDARGVLACDVSDALIHAKASGPVYLARDSHWTPGGMQAAAESLQAFLREHVPGLPQGEVAYRAGTPQNIEHGGDLAVMLAPEDAVRFGMNETIQHQAVEGPDGKPWAPDPSGKLLLLGDSFANIFELEGMGWGAHGGLAAWLSLLLQQPLDTITQNGDGAHATRLRLNQALQRGDDRLAGKTVVIFAFAARELSLGDWKPELKLPPAAAASRQRPGDAGRISNQPRETHSRHTSASCESGPEA